MDIDKLNSNISLFKTLVNQMPESMASEIRPMINDFKNIVRNIESNTKMAKDAMESFSKIRDDLSSKIRDDSQKISDLVSRLTTQATP